MLILNSAEQTHAKKKGTKLLDKLCVCNVMIDESWTCCYSTEPRPCVPDAWAQGSVPHRAPPPASPAISEADTEETHVIYEPEEEQELLEVLDDPPTTINETGTMMEEEEHQGTPEEAMTPIDDDEQSIGEKPAVQVSYCLFYNQTNHFHACCA